MKIITLEDQPILERCELSLKLKITKNLNFALNLSFYGIAQRSVKNVMYVF